jgi:hypothetical protein
MGPSLFEAYKKKYFAFINLNEKIHLICDK